MKQKKRTMKKMMKKKGGVPSYLSTIRRNMRSIRAARRASRRTARASRQAEYTKSVNRHYREKLPTLIQSSIVNKYTNDSRLKKVERNINNYVLREVLLETIKESIQILMEGCRNKETIFQSDEYFYIRVFSKISGIKSTIETTIDIDDRFLIEQYLLDVVQDNHDIDCQQMQQILINLYAVYKIYKNNNENNFK